MAKAIIDIESALRPRMSPDDVIRLLGKPDRDEMPTEYKPQVIRAFTYTPIKLRLLFQTDKGWGYVSVERRWERAVHGYHCGDTISADKIDPNPKLAGVDTLEHRFAALGELGGRVPDPNEPEKVPLP